MKLQNAVRKFGRQIGAVAVVSAVISSPAFADATAAAAEITAAKSDIDLIGYAALGLLVAAALFKYMRRAL